MLILTNTIADAVHVYQLPKITLKDLIELALTAQTCHPWDFMELISELQMLLKREKGAFSTFVRYHLSC